MKGPEPGSQQPAIWRRRLWWISGMVVLVAVAVAVVWMVLLPTTHTVRIKPVIKPMPGGDTCYAEPFELTGVRRGDEVVFTNQTTGKVVITFDLGLSGPATIEIGSNSSKSVPVGSQVEENRKYFYSLSCAPSVVGDARPRIVIRASSEG